MMSVTACGSSTTVYSPGSIACGLRLATAFCAAMRPIDAASIALQSRAPALAQPLPVPSGVRTVTESRRRSSDDTRRDPLLVATAVARGVGLEEAGDEDSPAGLPAAVAAVMVRANRRSACFRVEVRRALDVGVHALIRLRPELRHQLRIFRTQPGQLHRHIHRSLQRLHRRARSWTMTPAASRSRRDRQRRVGDAARRGDARCRKAGVPAPPADDQHTRLVGRAQRQHTIGQRLGLVACQELGRGNRRTGPAPSRAPRRVEDGHVSESRRHTAVTHRIVLRGLAFAVIEYAADPVRRLAADHVHRAPEHRRVGLIGDVAAACRRSCRCEPRRTPALRTGSCSADDRSTTSRCC